MKRLAILDDYERAALGSANWGSLAPRVAVTAFHDHVASEAMAAERLREFHVVCAMRERTPFRRSLLERLPTLEHLITSGMRNAAIDLAAAAERGIVVTGTPILPYPAAEHTWALLLGLAKRIPADDRALREGGWGSSINVGLNGKVLGIIGLGKVGAQVARIGTAFGMEVVAWSPNLTAERCAAAGAQWVAKESLFAAADFVTIHLVLGERTRGLVGAAELGRMRPTAYLINTSRGPIVEERALLDALEHRRIAGAALDVFDEEPLPAGHPFRRLPSTVLTPHQGYVTAENFQTIFTTAVDNVRRWLDGDIVNRLA